MNSRTSLILRKSVSSSSADSSRVMASSRVRSVSSCCLPSSFRLDVCSSLSCTNSSRSCEKKSERRWGKKKKKRSEKEKNEKKRFGCFAQRRERKRERERERERACVLIPQNYPIIINELHLAPMDLGCDKT